MPFDPLIAARLPLLDGIDSQEAMAADPALARRVEEFNAPFAPWEPPPAKVRDTAIDGPHGAIGLRVYAPAAPGDGPVPGLVWLHGGGMIAGDLDMPEADTVSHELCARAGAVVVSVDYHLAVDGVHFPVPHDDAVAAFRWVAAMAGELGIDLGRLSVGGASAGANLAAGAALHLRDDGDAVQPARLLLAYPLLHCPQPPHSPELEAAMVDVPGVLRFPPDVIRGLIENYLGGPTVYADPYALPANGVLAGLPPTTIVTCEYDDLRASGEAFAGQLADAGVPARIEVERGVMHGHLNRDPSLPGMAHSLEIFAAALAE